MSMVNWNDAPVLARYMATDENGITCWFENKPRINPTLNVWVASGQWKYKTQRIVDWKDSLVELSRSK